jgi:hypothetical protein
MLDSVEAAVAGPLAVLTPSLLRPQAMLVEVLLVLEEACRPNNSAHRSDGAHNTMTNKHDDPISEMKDLIGLEITAVCFVWTYIEFGFDGPVLRFLSRPHIRSMDILVDANHADYLALLTGLIGSTVRDLGTDDAYVRVSFSTGYEVILPSDAPADPTGEHLHFVPGPGRPIAVW